MANNAKMFDIVINKLYSDKPRAIVRELWSNAYDSHIAAGIPNEPFECQLPTVFDPTFRVRDHGVSLTHEDTMGLYTTVGASTKDQDNKANGKWGLGSKSPFAYGDTFTVTTWLNGEKRVYSAYRDAQRMPRMALMLTEPSDEQQGLEVGFPVAAQDCDAFYNAALKVALGFKVLPTMTGRQCQFVKLATQMGDGILWSLCTAAEGYFNSSTAYARQGCVVYPIDAGSIAGITDVQTAVLRSPFFIEFAIGDLEITPSRESLGYGGATDKNILDVVDIIIADIRAHYAAEIAACTTFWEACRAFAELQHGSLHDSLKKLLTAGMLWRGRPLVEAISLRSALSREELTVGPKAHATYYSPSAARRRRMMKWEPSSYISVSPTCTRIYFENARKQTLHAQGRIRYHFDQRYSSGALVAPTSLLWIKADPDSLSFKRLYAKLGRPPMVDVATLEKPPKDLNGYIRKPVKLKVMTLKSYGNKFESADIEETDDVVYIALHQRDIIGLGGRVVEVGYVRRVREALVELQVIDGARQIVGVPSTRKNVLKRNPHWRSIWDVANDAVAANFNPVAAAKANKCEEIIKDDAFEFVRFCIMNATMPASSISQLGKLISLYRRIEERAADPTMQREWFALAQRLDPDIKLPRYDVRWHPMAEKVKATYPMVEPVVNQLGSASTSICMDYVNLVDNS